MTSSLSVKKSYLLAYSVLQAVGWSACAAVFVIALFREPNEAFNVKNDLGMLTLKHDVRVINQAVGSLKPFTGKLLNGATWALEALNSALPGFRAAFSSGGALLGYLQLLAGLEIVHAVVGLVRGRPMNALMQWAGRSHVFFLALARIKDLQSSPAAGVLLLVWAIADAIRYPYMALQTMDLDIPLLTWLRYTAFIPLYPIGVLCEVWLLYGTVKVATETGLYSFSLPNAFNIGFSYAAFLRLLLALYIPLWWQLYSHLLKQRARKLPAVFEDAKEKQG